MRTLRVGLVGFGNVGRRFAALLDGPFREPLRRAGLRVTLTGVASGRHGRAIDARGLKPRDLVRRGSLDVFHRGPALVSTRDFIRLVPADALIEVTPLDPLRGEPALSHVRAALRRGLHVVTANKGPVAFALHALRALSRRRRVAFLYEAAVLDGAPVFNLVERCLPGVRVRAFRGTLNSTTGYVLSRVEAGASFAVALREAQTLGIAETDPRHDLDGWDAAVKGCALANALLDGRVRPAQVVRRGIQELSEARVRRVAKQGGHLRLVTRGERVNGRVHVSVAPERLGPGDPLAGDRGDSALALETDLMGEIVIIERGGTVDQTAYGLLSDLIEIAPRL